MVLARIKHLPSLYTKKGINLGSFPNTIPISIGLSPLPAIVANEGLWGSPPKNILRNNPGGDWNPGWGVYLTNIHHITSTKLLHMVHSNPAMFSRLADVPLADLWQKKTSRNKTYAKPRLGKETGRIQYSFFLLGNYTCHILSLLYTCVILYHSYHSSGYHLESLIFLPSSNITRWFSHWREHDMVTLGPTSPNFEKNKLFDMT